MANNYFIANLCSFILWLSENFTNKYNYVHTPSNSIEIRPIIYFGDSSNFKST